ncbi:hypothetical protein ABT278_41050 [Streptomyces sp. NPDC001228]|uniref:hypothetical protein n=1 Tax=Streptomyces sp. NPDC001228 TaxID=3154381 RepID=UPI00332818E8
MQSNGCTSCFAGLTAERVRDFRPTERGIRKVIADATTTFHERNGTLADVARPLADFRDGAPVIRFAHQPNLLSYLGILGQFALVQNLAQLAANIALRPVVPAYFVVDYDEAGNQRFHKSLLPDPRSRNGAVTLSYPLSRTDRKKTAFSLAAPAESITSDWMATFDRWTERYKSASRAHALTPLTEEGTEAARIALTELRTTYRRHQTFSDGNAAHLSRFINSTWGMPVLFIPLSVPAARLEGYLRDLADRLTEREGNATTYAWYICPHCYTRTAFSPTLAPTSLRCEFCSGPEEVGAHTKVGSGGLTGNIRPRIAPKVLMDTLADYELYGVVAGTGYAGGLAHMRRTRAVGQRMGISTAELSVRFSYQQDEQLRFAKGDCSRTNSLVRSGRGSMLYYLSILGLENLRRQLSSSIFRNSCGKHESQED